VVRLAFLIVASLFPLDRRDCMDTKNKSMVLLLSSFFEFIYLNLLWLLFSLPIITAFPAMTAMFGVIRKWKIKKEVDIFSTFYEIFKENFVKSFLIGTVGMLMLLILIVDLELVNNLSPLLQISGWIVLSVLLILLLFTSSYVFSILVHLEASAFQIIRNAFTLAVLNPVITFFKLLIMLCCAYVVFRVPVSIFGIGSLGAYYIYSIDHKLFEKYKKAQGNYLGL
jgi:uncharacterized membrane protein YesL